MTKIKQDTLDALDREGQGKFDEVKNTEGLSAEEKADEIKCIEKAVEDAMDKLKGVSKKEKDAAKKQSTKP